MEERRTEYPGLRNKRGEIGSRTNLRERDRCAHDLSCAPYSLTWTSRGSPCTLDTQTY